MQKPKLRRTLGLSAAALITSATAGWAAIEVEVNGRAVQFGAVQPARLEGRVFIPLRAVVESLGADIKWDAPTQTVRGSKGERQFSLQIGSRDASVNGKPVTLDVPAQLISGTTMVPLRFVAEALGAEVEWNAAAQRVGIQAPEDGAPVAANPGRVEGEVVAVKADGRNQTLTVRVNGVRNTYAINQDTIVLRGPEGKRGAAAELGDIRVGEKVRLRVNAEAGTAEVVEAFIADAGEPGNDGAITGRVTAIRQRGESRTITVETPTGRTVYVLPANSEISRIVGNRRPVRGTFDDIHVGDEVSLVPDALGQAIRSLVVRAGNDAPGNDLPGNNLPGNDPRNENRVTGEVIAVRPNSRPATITVRSGNDRVRYEVAADATILRRAGVGRPSRSTLEAIQPGDEISLRTDAAGEVARFIITTPLDGAAAPLEQARDLRINSFTHSGQGRIRGGQKIDVTLMGTPGGEAFFDVGSVAKNVPLEEDRQRPGRYFGTYTVPKGVTAKEVNIIGQLRQGNRAAPLVQAATAVEVDSEAPKVAEFSPADKGQTTNQQPDIYAEISDGAGTGIDEESLKVTVKGQDVTRQVKLTPRFLLYTPRNPLAPGPVPVVITVRDKAGNETESTWTFNVRPASDAVQSVTHNAAEALKVGDTLTVTVKAQPRSKVNFSLGDLVRNRALTETSAGNFVGRYTVKEGDQVIKAPVAVEVVTPDGDRVRQEATAPVNILTREPEAPTITSHAEDKPLKLGSELIVTGRGVPGSKIVVDVSYRGKAFGALPVKGTFGTQEVTVDKNGVWTSEPFAVRLSLGVSRPEITIQALSVDAAGRESKPEVVTVTAR